LGAGVGAGVGVGVGEGLGLGVGDGVAAGVPRMNWATAVIWAADNEPAYPGMAPMPLLMAVVN
jgi:hypothetical protein